MSPNCACACQAVHIRDCFSHPAELCRTCRAGSIVYGHGIPNNVTANMRLAISTLTDSLFLLISIRLLDGISCDYSDPAVSTEAGS